MTPCTSTNVSVYLTTVEATLEAVGASETLEPTIYYNTWRRIPDLIVIVVVNT